MAHVYERQNYIKKRIELTNFEMEEDYRIKAELIGNRYMS